MLINHGANIDAEDPNTGKSAIMIASENGYVDVVQDIIDFHASINSRDLQQKTPLLYAIESKNNAKNQDVVMKLIHCGADVNAYSIDGCSPLTSAVTKG